MPTLAQTLPTTPAITRADSLRDLPEGTDELVQELHLQATASVRAYSRQAFARACAEDFLARELVNVIQPTPRHAATLLRLEAGGVGGPGGYAGHATRRMSPFWGIATRNSGAGPAWTAAIQAAANACAEEAGDVHVGDMASPQHVRDILIALDGADLEWPLAYALRAAHIRRYDVARSTEWAELARDVAVLCEPDDPAGELAHRYHLRTLAPLVSWGGSLTAEVCADMLGLSEAELLARVDQSTDTTVEFVAGPITVAVHAADEFCTPDDCPDDRLFRVDVSTRESSSAGACEAMRLAWESAGCSMYRGSVDAVTQMCAALQPWASAPALRWPAAQEVGALG